MYIIYNDNLKQISIYSIYLYEVYLYVHLQVETINSSILYHEINLLVELHVA